jgi:hypothetical protein
MSIEKSAQGQVADRIHFEVPTRADAESLRDVLERFGCGLVSDGEQWLVELSPTSDTAPLLLDLFDQIGRWLEERKQASIRVRFGERGFTIMRPSDARPGDSAEFLLERVIQLQNALDSRVRIEQAKGVIAAQLRIDVEDAFDVLRGAARRAGERLLDLAEEVIARSGEELPEPIERFLRARRHRPLADDAEEKAREAGSA